MKKERSKAIITGVHSNQDHIWPVKIVDYIRFDVDRRSWLLWSPVTKAEIQWFWQWLGPRFRRPIAQKKKIQKEKRYISYVSPHHVCAVVCAVFEQAGDEALFTHSLSTAHASPSFQALRAPPLRVVHGLTENDIRYYTGTGNGISLFSLIDCCALKSWINLRCHQLAEKKKHRHTVLWTFARGMAEHVSNCVVPTENGVSLCSVCCALNELILFIIPSTSSGNSIGTPVHGLLARYSGHGCFGLLETESL